MSGGVAERYCSSLLASRHFTRGLGFESLRLRAGRTPPGSTPAGRPKALVAQWIAHRFPGPGVAGSSPAEGTRAMPLTPVAQWIECQFTKLRMGVRFSPGVLRTGKPAELNRRERRFPEPESVGSNPAVGTYRRGRRRKHGWYLQHAYTVKVAGSIPARRTTFLQCRIGSTGQSTCFVTRRRGFESCIRLHKPPHSEGSAAAAKRA